MSVDEERFSDLEQRIEDLEASGEGANESLEPVFLRLKRVSLPPQARWRH